MKARRLICLFIIFNLAIFNFVYAVPKKEEIISDGIYYIQSALDDSKCLDVQCASQEENAKVQLYEKNQTDAQKFYIYRVDNDYYEIRAVCSGKLVTSAGKKVGSVIVQRFHDDSEEQKWSILPLESGGVKFISKSSGLLLDVDGAKAENETKIQLWEDNDTKAQKFFLVPIKKFDISGYTVSNRKEDMQIDRIKYLMKFLGKNWSSEEIKTIIDNSQICFGAYDERGVQIGFIRAITDYNTTCFMMNLVVDPNCRGKGLGTWLFREIVDDKQLVNCRFSCIPSSEKVAVGYRVVGFRDTGWNYMIYR